MPRWNSQSGRLRSRAGQFARFLLFCLPVVAVWVITEATPIARAGGGPENVLLLVNANSESSKTVANHYIALRDIPANNVLYLDWKGNLEICSGKNFVNLILRPAIQAIEDRRLVGQIDYIVYSTDFPWRVELKPLFPDEEFSAVFQPIASITGATYLAGLLLSEKPNPAIVMPTVNWYVPQPKDEHVAACADIKNVPTRGFRFQYLWGKDGTRISDPEQGQHYFLSTSLGITQGRGNSVAEVISYLTRAKEADGKRPRGTIYFMRNNNIRSQVRHNCYADAAAALNAIGVQARVMQGKIPIGAKDVMGIMAGAESFDVAAAADTILPGAICEHLTSAGGIMSSNGYQTPLSDFLRAGAAAASGTVIEPRALQAKFPLPTLQVHYARGCSLAEAFFQSVSGPYQLLIVGDPLCQPWAVFPTLAVDGIKPNDTVQGDVEIRLLGAAAPGRQLSACQLIVDGRTVAQSDAGQSIFFKVSNLPQGYHELRVVAANRDSIETQGRTIVPFLVDNGTPALSFEVDTASLSSTGGLTIEAHQPGATSISIRQNSREVAKIEGDGGVISVPGTMLGSGPTTLQAYSAGPSPAISRPTSVFVR